MARLDEVHPYKLISTFRNKQKPGAHLVRCAHKTQTPLGDANINPSNHFGAKVLLTGQVAFAEAVKRAASGVEAG